ncbi:TIGR04211 family SH3 domain-containing protein [Parashewanella spongiae]|uniref:TIGR04211 family SH3 domain-containing protein n=1 Tax=Parashewanella spongiae TaxID=342950 RepID=A0A3A6TQT0_9GAMM|nr:TIGR04211 family SH3 domain-containing protein [Parashewanella spongiae]MCL1077414.1 TIGR04211 family SH3 domain-containing protein [Parashewanella spongiae]RJY18369.1 TIGR04211 family SH3 domain-containing protein [Parashewanella spongiae]
MFRLLTLVIALIIPFSLTAEEQQRYVSDSVYVYMHKGPGSQYKILGSVSAGELITLLPEASDGYSKIIDKKGREGWIRTNFVSNKLSLKLTVPKLEQQITELKQLLEQASNEVTLLRGDLDKAKQQLSVEQNARVDSDKKRTEAQAQLNDLKDDSRYQFWREGGIIAGIGLILGLLIAYLPRPSRRSRTKW